MIQRAEQGEELSSVDYAGGYYDDVHGGDLPPNLVKEARMEEVGFMTDRGIWEVVPISMCWDLTGKPPVTVRWVDTNKGDDVETNYRSRLVAKDIG